jgi:AraC family ethanolamine operon transcriptional activator
LGDVPTGTAAIQHLHFACVEEAEGLLQAAGLPIELLQLAPGPLHGGLLGLRIGPLGLLRVRLFRPVHVAGPKPRGQQVIAVPLEAQGRAGPLRAHGELLPQGCLFGLHPRGEIHLTTPAVTDLAVVMLASSHFREWALALGGPELDERTLSRNWVPLDGAGHRRLRSQLARIFSQVMERPELPARPGWERRTAGDLMPLLVEALVQGAQLQSLLRRQPARIELVKAAQRWMTEHPQQPITLDSLCREVHAGRRSLIQGFHDHLGMGPMAYLKGLRLHALRRQLLRADPGETRIHHLAADWGFLNPGHFARDYRRLFGERPSETLARSAS